MGAIHPGWWRREGWQTAGVPMGLVLLGPSCTALDKAKYRIDGFQVPPITIRHSQVCIACNVNFFLMDSRDREENEHFLRHDEHDEKLRKRWPRRSVLLHTIFFILYVCFTAIVLISYPFNDSCSRVSTLCEHSSPSHHLQDSLIEPSSLERGASYTSQAAFYFLFGEPIRRPAQRRHRSSMDETARSYQPTRI